MTLIRKTHQAGNLPGIHALAQQFTGSLNAHMNLIRMRRQSQSIGETPRQVKPAEARNRSEL
jgi:hypothetical protein